MGTRLGVLDKKTDKYLFYGTKLYGYCDNIKEAKSYEYLLKTLNVTIDEMDEWFINETWWWDGIELEMTGKQVKEFMKLYFEDLLKIKEYTEEEKKDLLNYYKEELESIEKIKDEDTLEVNWG